MRGACAATSSEAELTLPTLVIGFGVQYRQRTPTFSDGPSSLADHQPQQRKTDAYYLPRTFHVGWTVFPLNKKLYADSE